MHRAFRLEKALGTPAKIYFKYEGTIQQVVIKQILQLHKHTTTSVLELKKLLQKLVQVNGEAHSP